HVSRQYPVTVLVGRQHLVAVKGDVETGFPHQLPFDGTDIQTDFHAPVTDTTLVNQLRIETSDGGNDVVQEHINTLPVIDISRQIDFSVEETRFYTQIVLGRLFPPQVGIKQTYGCGRYDFIVEHILAHGYVRQMGIVTDVIVSAAAITQANLQIVDGQGGWIVFFIDDFVGNGRRREHRIPVVDPESGRPVTPQCSRQKQAVPIRIVKSSEVRNHTPRFHRLAPAGDTRGCIDGFDQVVGIGS